MRSSKSRSRNKNRNRPSGGNVINRVFDSSGPEGKVRGTPQQVIDKYNQLARDAQLSGDRVATENFQQHAEHYTRLLAIATREVEARRDQHGQGDPRGDRGGPQGGPQGHRHGGEDGHGQQGQHPPRGEGRQRDDLRGGAGSEGTRDDAAGVIESRAEDSVGLVETPEARSDEDDAPRPKRRARRKVGGTDVPAEPAPPSAPAGEVQPRPRVRVRARAKAPVADGAGPDAE